MSRDQSVLAKKMGAFVHLSDREQAHLAQLQSARVRVASGKELVREGQSGEIAHILHAGWACCFKLLPDGGRQTIVSIWMRASSRGACCGALTSGSAVGFMDVCKFGRVCEDGPVASEPSLAQIHFTISPIANEPSATI